MSTPKPPRAPQQIAAPAVIPPIKEEDKAVQEAAAEAAMKRSRARGYRSTILRGMVSQREAATGQNMTLGTT